MTQTKEKNYLNIFEQISERPSKGDFKPEGYLKFLEGFKSYLEGFNWKDVKEGCEQRSDQTEKPFLLVSADLSGIQNTVYTISSKGALKSLRARSFMLELLCEHMCYELISNGIGDYNKFNKHVLFSGGGSLCVLLPNNEQSRDNVHKLKEEINEWAFNEFSGKLYIAIACLELSENQLGKTQFKDTWKILSDEVEKDKKQKFKTKLSRLFSNEFLEKSEPVQRTGKEECQICHRDNCLLAKDPFYSIEALNEPIKDEKKLTAVADGQNVFHALCAQLFSLGSGLTKLKEGSKIFRSDQRPEERAFIDFPSIKGQKVYYSISKSLKNNDFSWIVNEVDKEAPTFLYAYYTRIRKDVPIDKHDKNEDHPEKKMDPESNASFVELSKMARGADYIGCLRMDVDNMGRIFTKDLQNFSLENLALLSRLLNLFFKVYLNKICQGDFEGEKIDLTKKGYKENKGRNVSVIYAGGDDLFIAGAWDETAELCYEIQACFARYSGLGISGGLTLHKPDYPLYQMASVSGEAEHAAKTFKGRLEEKVAKNKIALFYTPYLKQTNEKLNTEKGKSIYWDKVHYALNWSNRFPLEIVEKLVELGEVNDDKFKLSISHSLIYKLFSLAEVWWQRDTMYIPEFMYIMNRFKKSKDVEYRTKIENLEEKIFKFPVKGNSQKHDPIRSMRIPLTWVDLLQRGGTTE